MVVWQRFRSGAVGGVDHFCIARMVSRIRGVAGLAAGFRRSQGCICQLFRKMCSLLLGVLRFPSQSFQAPLRSLRDFSTPVESPRNESILCKLRNLLELGPNCGCYMGITTVQGVVANLFSLRRQLEGEDEGEEGDKEGGFGWVNLLFIFIFMQAAARIFYRRHR